VEDIVTLERPLPFEDYAKERAELEEKIRQLEKAYDEKGTCDLAHSCVWYGDRDRKGAQDVQHRCAATVGKETGRMEGASLTLHSALISLL